MLLSLLDDYEPEYKKDVMFACCFHHWSRHYQQVNERRRDPNRGGLSKQPCDIRTLQSRQVVMACSREDAARRRTC